ncbi:hypothetical protein K437DRAFT_249687 [Tilletiaria anomala UBC 951]|uniref:Cytochrome c oxidase assembly protein COX20, mitochondrial n=1 Tax=Tilletiaria anomala (strain ATCC 24038 / CBS 436.72 / UBC 951) TaxID=1037660 RepID=A0A066VLU9_TILAU|nr:uncharacterized protein K437DRAFT_249687 [Tilletiaria anomala UBC 951]KDN41253.1 hypothetical protein K437DRAFT_249687 [Tilletiaria anomala UBC 951]
MSADSNSKLEAHRVRSAISQLSLDDFKNIPRIPCARNSLLLGIMTAGGVVGISAVARRGIRRALNWGVGGFCFVSLASWETCRRSRAAEKARMKMIVESYQRGGKAAPSSSFTSPQPMPLVGGSTGATS